MITTYLKRLYANADKPVYVRIHGYDAQINPGNPYPFIIDDYPLFNSPLVHVLNVYSDFLQRRVNLLDIGASFGDTVMLVNRECSSRIGSIVCVEGDLEFNELLERNTKRFQNVRRIKVVLARESKVIRSLVKHHQGSAAALGNDWITACTLDSIGHQFQTTVDLVKCDVDGFDGEVIMGGKHFLRSMKPLIIFEWHPVLINAVGAEYDSVFSTLRECNYDRLVWYRNTGEFSHFSSLTDERSIRSLARHLTRGNNQKDEHFDIVALPSDCAVDPCRLATNGN